LIAAAEAAQRPIPSKDVKINPYSKIESAASTDPTKAVINIV